MTTTTGRATPSTVRRLANALGGNRAGHRDCLTYSDEAGRTITLHVEARARRVRLAIDRIDTGPRSPAATRALRELVEEQGGVLVALSRNYVSADFPTALAPSALLRLVGHELGWILRRSGARR